MLIVEIVLFHVRTEHIERSIVNGRVQNIAYGRQTATGRSMNFGRARDRSPQPPDGSRLETVQTIKNKNTFRLGRRRVPPGTITLRQSCTMSDEPRTDRNGQADFSVQHDRFQNSLRPSDWDEFSALADDPCRIRFVYGRLYVDGDRDRGDDRCKDGPEALEMKKSGTARFQKSDYRNALNWYSLAALRCPQTEG